MTPLRILYVHHAGPFGGASRSLYELIRSFPKDSVKPLVLTRRGQFLSILSSAGIEAMGCYGVSQFDNTQYSYYRGLRWLVLLREIAYLPLTLAGLFSARKRWGDVDLVHINDMTLVPTIWLARKLFSCPVVVHVRSVQRPLSDLRGILLRWFFQRNINLLVAIDDTVRRSIDDVFQPVVVHNGLVVGLDPVMASIDSDGVFTVGMVGSLSRSKGCLEFVEAARICLERGAKIRFVFVGQTMRQPAQFRDAILKYLGLSQEIEGELRARISALFLDSVVEFWPFTMELDKVYARLDLICFPSHFDAPGRPIFEAALFGVPAIAAISAPTEDTMVEGLTGMTIPSRNPTRLAETIMFLASNRHKCRVMGDNARKLSLKYFDIQKNALRILELYSELLRHQENSGSS
jgi:glycosyltransferase involved in cell wall biosynthesis